MPDILKTAVFCLVFIAVGAYVGYLHPVNVLSLDIGKGGVAGVLQDRILGVIPIKSRYLEGVRKAILIDTPEDIMNDGPTTILLDTRGGDIVYTHFAWIRAEGEVNRINNYIRDAGLREFVTWRANWPYTLVSLFLVLGPIIYFILQLWQSITNSIY